MFPNSREPRILEIRIHGIKNAPPWEMLDTKPEDIKTVKGDKLGSFWIRTKPASDNPRGVRREAYSWGAMARNGGQKLPFIGQLFVHIGWLLILPFGFCNLAYWTRRIPNQSARQLWEAGVGAKALRVFSLGLTLLYVAGLSSVFLDVIGTQCFTVLGVCSQLPEVADKLLLLSRGGRMVVLSIIPVLAIMLLYILASRARVRFNPSANQAETHLLSPKIKSSLVPQLATSNFWLRARVGPTSERLHFAAAIFLVVLLVAWDATFGGVPECSRTSSLFTSGCVSTAFSTAPWSATLVIVAFVGLVLCGVLVARATESLSLVNLKSRRWAAAVVLVVAVLVFVGNAIVVFVSDAAAGVGVERVANVERTQSTAGFLGLEATPIIILIGLLAVCFSGLGWRRQSKGSRWLSALLLLLAAISLAARFLPVSDDPGNDGWRSALPWLSAGVAAGFVLLHLIAVVAGRSSSQEDGDPESAEAPQSPNEVPAKPPAIDPREPIYTGWRNTGPGILMLLSLGFALILSSAVVVGSTAWLATAGNCTTCKVWRVPVGFTPGDATALNLVPTAPRIYVDFSIVLFVGLIAVVVYIAIAVLRQLSRLYRFTTPAILGGGEATDAVASYGNGKPQPVAADASGLFTSVHAARRFAGIMHRTEPIVGAVAAAFGVGIAVCAGLLVAGKMEVLEQFEPLGASALAAAMLLAITVVAENALTTQDRPVGVLWDLICFLPRAGHPFGPPCYSERVVPELNARIREWLGPADRPNGNRVVLSAHSMGCVIAVSTLFARYADETDKGVAASDTLTTMGLLTYGVQLRPYFGRFFPEIFGPRALGVRPVRSPSLFRADPWFTQVTEDEADRLFTPPPTSLTALLTKPKGSAPAWVSLWRRTDFLGFPADSYATSAIDRGADEFEAGTYLKTIATHSGYWTEPQYLLALQEVGKRLEVSNRLMRPPRSS